MNSPLQFYTQEKQIFESELARFKRKLINLSIIRLVIFLATIYGAYYFSDSTKIMVPILIVGIILFFFLVSIHSDLKHKKRKAESLIYINQREINVINGNVSELETGTEFQDPSHEFSYDVDLFGLGSFFQYLNRTTLLSGKKWLASTLTSNNIYDIQQKQDSIKELAEQSKWRQNFSATGSLIQVNVDAERIVLWLQNHKAFVPATMRFIPHLFSVISLCILVLNYFNFVPLSITTLWFFIGIGITGIYIKKINPFYQNANKAKETFKQYYQLLSLIESQEFKATILKSKQEEIKTESKKASEIFLQFSKTLDAFDQRNNMIVGIFANAFALRDLYHCYQLEQWIDSYKDKVEKWFEVIAFFDAQNSLANYSFNHPNYTFPTITNSNHTLETSGLGHPLILSTKRIDNDLAIKNDEFFIITGANMAGKSTFLRTVSLAIIMANTGLPICAKEVKYSPIQLITSMRTSDSLTDDESYFFSELKRLKYIIEQIKSEKYFIILDEILKGTNSTDKAIGSRKFVEKLVASNATGIIATHDLSLCEISTTLEQVKNYYFDAEIINDELHFDYTFKTGICQNMNASFLLKKMEII
ncbi:MAG: DNA mismatch repair ATPase MutS [Flavobacteriaceae bacterium]|jgi:DNA mismatch repair ATPase MutS